MNFTKNYCPVCGIEIKGRRDKKFCSDQCRANFNNEKRRDTEGFIQSVNSILRKNRSILKAINPEGKTTIRIDYLIIQGFDFRHFTNYYRTKNGNIYFFCYEFGYCKIDPEKLVIITHQDYMAQMPNQVPDF